MKERLLKQRWNEVKVTVSGEVSPSAITDLINHGYSRLHRPYTVRRLLNGTFVAQPRNPLHLLWRRNGIKNKPTPRSLWTPPDKTISGF